MASHADHFPEEESEPGVNPPVHPRDVNQPILFIVADDLGWADLSVYGQTEYATPHLDRLAAQGVRFTQAYANSAVCSATRFALMTGATSTACRAVWKNRSPKGAAPRLAAGAPPRCPHCSRPWAIPRR